MDFVVSDTPKLHVQALWKQETGQAVSSYSQTRWWSRWEAMNQVVQMFGDFHPFLTHHVDANPATRSKLLNILNDPQQLLLLKSELAAIIDIGSYFVWATYNLEGEGVLVLKCYEELLTVRAAIHARYYSNLQDVAR